MFNRIRDLLHPVQLEVVSEADFKENLYPLNNDVKAAIEQTIFKNQGNIVKFMYGHQPRHRVFKIVFYEGEPLVWDLRRPFIPAFRWLR